MRQPVPAACQRPAADRTRLPRASVMTHIKSQSNLSSAALIHAGGAVWRRALAAAGWYWLGAFMPSSLTGPCYGLKSRLRLLQFAYAAGRARRSAGCLRL